MLDPEFCSLTGLVTVDKIGSVMRGACDFFSPDLPVFAQIPQDTIIEAGKKHKHLLSCSRRAAAHNYMEQGKMSGASTVAVRTLADVLTP